ncbi:hypothetical protein TNCV_2305611 [Trichonephila clavipes]|nr:hypothetical protein TNCV_2305611 [Trichonephila clavipes]
MRLFQDRGVGRGVGERVWVPLSQRVIRGGVTSTLSMKTEGSTISNGGLFQVRQMWSLVLSGLSTRWVGILSGLNRGSRYSFKFSRSLVSICTIPAALTSCRLNAKDRLPIW